MTQSLLALAAFSAMKGPKLSWLAQTLDCARLNAAMGYLALLSDWVFGALGVALLFVLPYLLRKNQDDDTDPLVTQAQEAAAKERIRRLIQARQQAGQTDPVGQTAADDQALPQAPLTQEAAPAAPVVIRNHQPRLPDPATCASPLLSPSSSLLQAPEVAVTRRTAAGHLGQLDAHKGQPPQAVFPWQQPGRSAAAQALLAAVVLQRPRYPRRFGLPGQR